MQWLTWQPPETSWCDILKSMGLFVWNFHRWILHLKPFLWPFVFKKSKQKYLVCCNTARIEGNSYGDIMLNFDLSAGEVDIVEMSWFLVHVEAMMINIRPCRRFAKKVNLYPPYWSLLPVMLVIQARHVVVVELLTTRPKAQMTNLSCWAAFIGSRNVDANVAERTPTDGWQWILNTHHPVFRGLGGLIPQQIGIQLASLY